MKLRIPKFKVRAKTGKSKNTRRLRINKIIKKKTNARQKALPPLNPPSGCGPVTLLPNLLQQNIRMTGRTDLGRYVIDITDVKRNVGDGPLRLFSSFIFQPSTGWDQNGVNKYYNNVIDNYIKMLDFHQDRYLLIGFYNVKPSSTDSRYSKILTHPRILQYDLEIGSCDSEYIISFESTVFRYLPMTFIYTLNGIREEAVIYMRDAHLTVSMNSLEDVVLSHYESTGAKLHLYSSPNYFPPHAMGGKDYLTTWKDPAPVISSSDISDLNPVNDPRQLKRVLAGLIGIRVGSTDDKLNMTTVDFWTDISSLQPQHIIYGIDEWYFTEIYYNPVWRKRYFNGDVSEHVSSLIWLLYILNPALDVFKNLNKQFMKRSVLRSKPTEIFINSAVTNSNRVYSLYADAHHAFYILATNYEIVNGVQIPLIPFVTFFEYIEKISKNPQDPLYKYARLIPLRTQLWDFVYNIGPKDYDKMTLQEFGLKWGITDLYSVFSSSARSLYGNGMEGKTSFSSFSYPLNSSMHVRYGIELQDLRRIDSANLGTSVTDFNVFLKYGKPENIMKEFITGRTMRDLAMKYNVSTAVEITDYQGLFIDNSRASLVTAMTNYIKAVDTNTLRPSEDLVNVILYELLNFYIEAMRKNIRFYHLDLHKENIIITSTNPLKIVIIDTEYSKVFYRGANTIQMNDENEILTYPPVYTRLNKILKKYARNYSNISTDYKNGHYRMIDLIDLFSFFINSYQLKPEPVKEALFARVEKFLSTDEFAKQPYTSPDELKRGFIDFVLNNNPESPVQAVPLPAPFPLGFGAFGKQ